MPDTWCIYHIKNCPYTHTDKFVVIVCKDSEYRGFFINTDELRPFIRKHHERLKFQIKIKASDYKFLNHDSWVNCYDLYPFEGKYLLDRRDTVNIITKAEIRKVIKDCEKIEARHQKLILHND